MKIQQSAESKRSVDDIEIDKYHISSKMQNMVKPVFIHQGVKSGFTNP